MDGDGDNIRAGDVVCDVHNQPVGKLAEFAVKVLAFEHVMPGFVDVLHGRMNVPGQITGLAAVADATKKARKPGDDGKKKAKPRVVKPGETAVVSVRLERGVPLEAGARVVLRAGGETIAAGLITEE